MQQQKLFSVYKLVWLLTPLVMALPLAMDVYVPALPHMSTLFKVAPGTMQLTLTLFMLVAGVMQLVVGPLSDQFGRKKVIYIVVAIFALGSILCSTANSVYSLIFYRGIEAIGSCGMLVLAFAIVRDMYSGEKSAKAYSFLNGIISFSPMFAPFIGSYLDIHFGWPATFLCLLLIAVWAGINCKLSLPETLPKQNRVAVTNQLFKEYLTIFSNKIFLPYTFITAAGLSYLYIFCSISPYIIIHQLQLPEANYGFYFSFMGVSILLGSFLGGFLVERLGIYHSVILGLILSLIGGVIMFVWYQLAGLTINGFIWPMLLIGIGGTFCMGAANGGAMEPFAHNTGAASALGGGLRFMFAGIIGALVVTKNVDSTLPLAMPAIIFSILGLVIMITMRANLYFPKLPLQPDIQDLAELQ